MFERFTNQSRYAIVAAQEEARSLDHDYIGSEHLLLGLLREDQGTSARALASAGITLEAARHDVEALIGRGERPPSGHIPFTRRAKKCLELSLREALQLGHRYIGTTSASTAASPSFSARCSMISWMIMLESRSIFCAMIWSSLAPSACWALDWYVLSSSAMVMACPFTSAATSAGGECLQEAR